MNREIKPEIDILKTTTGFISNFGAKIMVINEGIDGNCLNATDKEKLEYINSLNADIYIKVELYEGKLNYRTLQDGNMYVADNGKIGYYRNSDEEIIKEYIGKNKYFTEEENNNRIEETMIKLDNEYVANNCEIPVIVHFKGYVQKNGSGEYFVDFFEGMGWYNFTEFRNWNNKFT